MAAAKFCQQQSHALEVLRQRQRKDQKMAAFLQASHVIRLVSMHLGNCVCLL